MLIVEGEDGLFARLLLTQVSLYENIRRESLGMFRSAARFRVGRFVMRITTQE